MNVLFLMVCLRSLSESTSELMKQATSSQMSGGKVSQHNTW